MYSLPGWLKAGQRPEFDEYTLVPAGQPVATRAGEWPRDSTPAPEGAEYRAICLPAFSPATVHREPA